MESRLQDADTFRRVTGHASSIPSSQCSSHRTALPGGVRPSGADTETSPLVATWRQAEGHGTLGRPQEKKAQTAGCAERDVRIKVCQLQNGAWRGHRGGGSLLPPPPASPLAPAQHPALPAPLLPPKAGELVRGAAALRGTVPVAPGLRGYVSPFGTQPACWEAAEANCTRPPVTQWTQRSHIPRPQRAGRWR